MLINYNRLWTSAGLGGRNRCEGKTLRQELSGSRMRDDADADRELPNQVGSSITEMGRESHGHRRWPTLSRDVVNVLRGGSTCAPSQKTRALWGAGSRCCRDREHSECLEVEVHGRRADLPYSKVVKIRGPRDQSSLSWNSCSDINALSECWQVI